MTGWQPAFRISGHPVAQFLSMIILGVVVVVAVIIGAFAFIALFALFAVGYAVFYARVWWRWRKLRGAVPFGGHAASERSSAARYIEGDYEVVEARPEPPRGHSGTR